MFLIFYTYLLSYLFAQSCARRSPVWGLSSWTFQCNVVEHSNDMHSTHKHQAIINRVGDCRILSLNELSVRGIYEHVFGAIGWVFWAIEDDERQEMLIYVCQFVYYIANFLCSTDSDSILS